MLNEAIHPLVPGSAALSLLVIGTAGCDRNGARPRGMPATTVFSNVELVRPPRFDRSIFRQANRCYGFSTDNGAHVGGSLPIDRRLNL